MQFNMAILQILIISLIILMNSCKESAAMCPKPLVPFCTCLPMEGGMWNITCKADDVAGIIRALPENTSHFTYIACELFVQLGNTNFKGTPNLRSLSINDCGDYYVLQRKIYPSAANDRMFEYLHELRELAIHINWEMQTELANLFANLTHLEVLDLSNTRLINLDNLIASIEGLRQSVNLTVLNLWNIKTMEHSSPNLHLQLDQLLEPLSNSSLEVLNIGYNAFRTITPGIIQFAPKLKHLILRNNVLIPLVCSLITEALLHKTLEELDIREQGFRPEHDYTEWYGGEFGGYGSMENKNTMMRQDNSLFRQDNSLIFKTEGNMNQCNINSLNPDLNPTKERKLGPWQPNNDLMNPHNLNNLANNETVNKFVGNTTASEQSPISRSGIQSIITEFIECFILLYKDTCNIFQLACKPLKQLLIDEHELFCGLLDVFFQWDFTRIHCDYIPAFNDLIQEDCGACLVIPSVGNMRKLMVSNVNVYDRVLMYPNYRDKPLCFHPHSMIEYIDVSANVPHGYPELSLIFHPDVKGLGNLTFINGSRLGIHNLYTNVSTSYPNLLTFDASHNQITLSEKEPIILVTQTVENFDLSYNQISQLAENKFVELYSLKRLDLSNNLISEFSVNLTASTGLEYLGLANNQLTSLPELMIQQLNDIALANSSKTLNVNLAGNDWICTCATKPFMAWILHSHSPNLVFTDGKNYMCSNRYSNKVPLQKVTMYSINRECYEPIIYACAGAAGALCLFLLLITYNRRWYLRHKWYLFTRDVTKRGYIHRQHDYAAYICFNSNDDDDVRNWVDFNMKQQLNEFKIAYGHEAVEFGRNINQEVELLVKQSYRSVLVLTPAFVANANLMYEVNIIVDKLKDSGADSLVVIVRKSLSSLGIDPTLKLLMERHLCLEWVEDNTDAHKYFWERLKDVIGSPCRELFARNEIDDDQGALIQQP